MGHSRGRGKSSAKQFPSSRTKRRLGRIHNINGFDSFETDEYVEHFSSSSKRHTRQFQTDDQETGRRVKKTWSRHDIKNVTGKTENQAIMLASMFKNENTFAFGSAGSGKTFLAMYAALHLLFDKESPFERIIIVRSAVPTRNMGFMPGTLEEKSAMFETPYVDICTELLQYKNAYQDLKEIKKIEFMTTSFIRGMTFDKAIVILDECQSATYHELYSVMTRIGENTQVIVCGDGLQDDLHSQRGTERSGFQDLLTVVEGMKDSTVVRFTENDIVRSGFVRDFIIRSQRLIKQ